MDQRCALQNLPPPSLPYSHSTSLAPFLAKLLPKTTCSNASLDSHDAEARSKIGGTGRSSANLPLRGEAVIAKGYIKRCSPPKFLGSLATNLVAHIRPVSSGMATRNSKSQSSHDDSKKSGQVTALASASLLPHKLGRRKVLCQRTPRSTP